MPLPLLLKAALIGGAAYAATRWYTSQGPGRARALGRVGRQARLPSSSDIPREMTWPSTDSQERPHA